jgi:hypothetical protein
VQQGEHDGHDAETTGGDETDEELAVQEYMARLLQRLRAGGQSGGWSSDNESRQAHVVRAVNQPSENPAPSEEAVLPRRVAPEKHVDLRAMRELALSSARSALACHARRSAREDCRRLLLYAVLSAAASCVSWAIPNPVWPLVNNIATITGAVLALTLAATAVRHALRGKSASSA